MRVFDVVGRLVGNVARGEFDAGDHLLRWDPASAGHGPGAPGIYLVEVRAMGARITRRAVVLE